MSEEPQQIDRRVTQYIDIFDGNGQRVTSLPLIPGSSMDDLKEEASERFPDYLAVDTSYEDHKLYVNGYTYDKETETPVPPPEPTEEELADQEASIQAAETQTKLNGIANRATLSMLGGGSVSPIQAEYQTALFSVTDRVALKIPNYFPVWDNASHEYKEGDRVTYNGTLYKCLQAHTSQDSWTPADAPSLWAKVLITGTEDTPPEWQQPGSTNPYMKGDKVTLDGKVYESLIDNNVWKPDEYPAGWKLVE